MISDVQRARIRRLFRVYDANRDGVLTQEDFTLHAHRLAGLRGLTEGSQAFRTLRDTLVEYWGNLERAADANRDGRVTQEEWIAFASGMLGALQQASDHGMEWPLNGWIDALYGIMDADGDGRITLREYRDWCESLGIAGEMDVEEAFRGFDKASPDHLSRDEFVAISRQFWLNSDPTTPGARWVGPCDG
jgi:juvenile hormone diol kinase